MCLKDFDESERKNEKSAEMEKTVDCPLCLEALEFDDKKFFPCTCGYQVCRFCWHRIRTNENGLCPACRRTYTENPANFQPLTPEELQKVKHQKKMKDLQKKQKIAENRKQLGNIRVIQKNLVFGVGFPLELSQDNQKKEKVLQMFKQFGPTHKEAITDRTTYAGSQGPSACVYITYQKPEDAVRAVKYLTNTKMEGRTIKVSLGTTKYCSNFLKNVHCPKAECLYLHEIADEEASFTKDDIHAGKHLDYEQKLLEQTSNSTSNKVLSPSNQINRTNMNQNIDNSSESSDEPPNSSLYDSSEASELSPSSNSQNLEHRSIDLELNLEVENNCQNHYSNISDLRSNVFDNSSKSMFKVEKNSINSHSQQNSSMPNTSPSNTIKDFNQIQLPKESETLQQSNFLKNQIFETAFQQIGQSSSSNDSNLLNFISSALSSDIDTTNSYKSILSMKKEHVDPEPVQEAEPDLEFDPCQESLNALQDLIISEAREKARIHYNALNRSPLSNKSPTLPHHHSADGFGLRNSFCQPLKIRDPPPGFGNSYPPNVYKSFELNNSIINRPPLAMHNQIGIRANFPHQRFQQPGVSVNGSSFVEFSPQVPCEVQDITPMLQQQQNTQRLMNLSQAQFPVTEQRTSPQWTNAPQNQWRPAENAFFNQSISENRASAEFNLRMHQHQLRSNEIRQWQQMNGNVNLSPYADMPQPMTSEQFAKIQAMYKAFEASQRNSGSVGGHRLQYTKNYSQISF